MQIDRASLNSLLWGRIYLWWLDHGGHEPQDTCGLKKAFLFSLIPTWIFEAGFGTKYRIIRPITLIYLIFNGMLLLPAYQEYLAMEILPVWSMFWLTVFAVYLIVSILYGPYYYETDKKKAENRWVDRFLWLFLTTYFNGLFALVGYIFGVLPKKLTWLFETRPFQLLGELFRRLGETMDKDVNETFKVWHFVAFAAFLFVWIFVEDAFLITVGVVLFFAAVVLLVIYGSKFAAWLAEDVVPSWRESAEQKRERLHRVGRRTTNEMLSAIWKSLKERYCQPIKWTGEYHA